MSLKSIIQSDINNVFFKNDEEYSDYMKIGTNSANAVSVLGSLQVNTIDNNSGNNAALQAFSHTLHIPYPIGGVIKVNAGQILYIDDIAYRVNDISIEYGVATILLNRKG